MIIIESKRKKPTTILKQYPDAILAAVIMSKYNRPIKSIEDNVSNPEVFRMAGSHPR